ncbi:MAG: transporter substrate-binding domain-containing protein [Clostridia bacterium]|nr:transporter substrate-binding domain-containing protein [Clostridia bacterium]
MKKWVAILLAAVLFTALAAGCTPNTETDSPQKTQTDMEYVKEKGTLIVGITDFAPMDYQENGEEWIGFDADMAKAFAEKLGVDVKFVVIEWGKKVMELNAKSIDCVWNGMTLNDEVKAAMETSQAYCNNAQVVVVSKDKAEDITTVDACKTLKFAVEAGSTGRDQAQENGFDFVEVQDQATALMEVAAGTSDAAIIDSLMAAAMIGEGTQYEDLTYTISLNSEEYGVGFRQGSDLAAELNAFFAEAKESGLMRQLAEKYGVQAALID